MKKRASVCLATYNGEKFILELLNSILPQLSADDEIIITDDSSSDRTLDIVRKINDPRILIFPNNTFKSPIKNFENAIKHATGDFIFLCDQDDIWTDNKLEKVLELLAVYDVVLHDCYVVDQDLQLISSSFYKLNNTGRGLFKNIIRNGYLGCCLAFRKNVAKIILPFPVNIPMHDIWIGFVAELFFKVYFTKDRLLLYRRHGNNASPTSEKSRYSLVHKMKFRINLILNLPSLFFKRFLN